MEVRSNPGSTLVFLNHQQSSPIVRLDDCSGIESMTHPSPRECRAPSLTPYVLDSRLNSPLMVA